jgi:hypothetical protein
MRNIAFRGSIRIPVSGNGELQAQRILAIIAQRLEMEGAILVSRRLNRYSFKAGFRSRPYDSSLVSFIKMMTSGEISISQTGSRQSFVYRICFDELAFVLLGVCAVFGILTLGSALKTQLIFSLAFFLIIAFITMLRFHRFLLSCLKEAGE